MTAEEMDMFAQAAETRDGLAICPECHGEGYTGSPQSFGHEDDTRPCDLCNCKGEVPIYVRSWYNNIHRPLRERQECLDRLRF